MEDAGGCGATGRADVSSSPTRVGGADFSDRIARLIVHWLGPGGHALTPGHAHRAAQQKLAQEVLLGLVKGVPVLAQGPTGVGKTLAISVAATLYASGQADGNKHRVALAVATNTLCDQLATTLRDVAEKAGMPPPAVLKGRRNYACPHGITKARKELREEATEWMKHGGFDLTAYPRHLERFERRQLTIASEGCSEARESGACSHWRRSVENPIPSCPLYAARVSVLESPLVVTNVDLWMLEAQLQKWGSPILGDFDAVIFDEAHELPGRVRDRARGTLRVKNVRSQLDTLHEQLDCMVSENDTTGMRKALEELTTHLDALQGHFDTTAREALDAEQGFSLVHRAEWLPALSDGAKHAENIKSLIPRFLPGCQDRELTRKTAEGLARTLSQWAKDVSFAGTSNRCLWVEPFSPQKDEEGEEEAPAEGLEGCVRQEPIRAGKQAEEWLWGRTESVAFVSATLYPDGSPRWFCEQLGFDTEKVRAIRVESPFHFDERALVYVPRDVPTAKGTKQDRKTHDQAASLALQELATVLGGRLLVLCPSREDMRTAHAALEQLNQTRIEQQLEPFPLLMQGEGSNAVLAERKKKEPTSCLVATAGFGTGFDCPGEALEGVVVWRLPFPVPSPVDAKDQLSRPKTWYRESYLPRMLLVLQQWFGRLIRTKRDRGIVGIFDGRAVSPHFRRAIGAALPELEWVRALESVEVFLAGVQR